MKIIIAGVGKLGEYLARSLVKEENEVTVIDVDLSDNKNLINNEDLNYINGNALDHSILEEADISSTDILISVMEKDEQNIMCCLLGKKLGAKHTIARIRKPEYTNTVNILKEELGLSMIINPELLTARHISNILSIPSILDVTMFFKGRIEIVSLKIKENSKLIGYTISNLSKKINSHIIICAIERNNDVIIPRGNTKVQLGDKLHVTGTPKAIMEFLKFSTLAEKKTKQVIICGGSNTAIYLTRILEEMDMKVKIIDISEERCKFLSEVLPKTLIINGDVSDQNILFEEDIDKCDALVTLNSIDEENIVTSIFASQLKVPKIITKVNHINLDGVIESSNLDTIITPHKIATNQIVHYVRAMQNSGGSSCESIYKFADDKFEVLEFNIRDDFAMVNKKIKDLPLKSGILIIAIWRGRKVIFPGGDEEINKMDTIIVINDNNKVKDINDILE